MGKGSSKRRKKGRAHRGLLPKNDWFGVKQKKSGEKRAKKRVDGNWEEKEGKEKTISAFLFSSAWLSLQEKKDLDGGVEKKMERGGSGKNGIEPRLMKPHADAPPSAKNFPTCGEAPFRKLNGDEVSGMQSTGGKEKGGKESAHGRAPSLFAPGRKNKTGSSIPRCKTQKPRFPPPRPPG